MSKTAFDHARPILRAWLEACHEHHTITTTEDYDLYVFARDALGSGTIELIDNEDLSQGHDILAMALPLQLAPPSTPDDILAILSLAEWSYNTALVWKDLDGEGHLAVQLKIPADTLTPQALDTLYKTLLQAKRFYEE